LSCLFLLQAEDGIRVRNVTGVQTCALPICLDHPALVATADPGSAFACLRADEDGEPLLSEAPKEAELVSLDFPSDIEDLRGQDRSEERRVGKEGASTEAKRHSTE